PLRRHERALRALDHAHDAAVVRLAGRQDRAVVAAREQALEGLQAQAAVRVLAAVALQAVAGEERLDLPGVALGLLRGRWSCATTQGQDGEQGETVMEHGSESQ